MTAAKKPAPKPKPKPTAAKSATPGSKVVGHDYDPLTTEDIAYNKGIDKYTADRNKGIRAEQQYAKRQAALKAKLSLQEKTESKHFKGASEKAEQAQRQKAFIAHSEAADLAAVIKANPRMAHNAAWIAQEKRYAAAAWEAPAAFTETGPKKPPAHLFDQLSGPNRDAYAAITTEFKKYGLETLAPQVFKYLQEGFNSDTITIMLQESNEYKQRFAANEARVKAGLPALSPADYLNTEQSYRQIMSQAGLPAGFYDKTSDFTNLLSKDISPSELSARVQDAKNVIGQAPAATKKALSDYYGLDESHMVAHALDPQVAEPILASQTAAAQIAGAAMGSGFQETNQKIAEEAARRGVTYQQAQNSYSQMGSFLGNAIQLAGIYHQDYTQSTAEKELLLGDANAQKARQKLASTERGQFQASGGVTPNSLAQGGR